MLKSKYSKGTVKNSGFEMDYIRFGSGRETLVILPGLSIGSVTASGKSIAEAYKIFWEKYTVYLFDRRKDIPEKYGIEEMAEDTFTAMTELGISGSDVFGVSQGGMMAQCMAIRHPSEIKKLVLGSTMSRISPASKIAVNEWIKAAQSGDKRSLANVFVKALYTDDFINKFGIIIKSTLVAAKDSDIERFIKLAESCVDFSVYEELGKITCPAFVIGAECDSVATKEASEEIADAMGCKLYIYPAPYAHAVYDEAPDYKQRILDFLENN